MLQGEASENSSGMWMGNDVWKLLNTFTVTRVVCTNGIFTSTLKVAGEISGFLESQRCEQSTIWAVSFTFLILFYFYIFLNNYWAVTFRVTRWTPAPCHGSWVSERQMPSGSQGGEEWIGKVERNMWNLNNNLCNWTLGFRVKKISCIKHRSN